MTSAKSALEGTAEGRFAKHMGLVATAAVTFILAVLVASDIAWYWGQLAACFAFVSCLDFRRRSRRNRVKPKNPEVVKEHKNRLRKKKTARRKRQQQKRISEGIEEEKEIEESEERIQEKDESGEKEGPIKYNHKTRNAEEEQGRVKKHEKPTKHTLTAIVHNPPGETGRTRADMRYAAALDVKEPGRKEASGKVARVEAEGGEEPPLREVRSEEMVEFVGGRIDAGETVESHEMRVIGRKAKKRKRRKKKTTEVVEKVAEEKAVGLLFV